MKPKRLSLPTELLLQKKGPYTHHFSYEGHHLEYFGGPGTTTSLTAGLLDVQRHLKTLEERRRVHGVAAGVHLEGFQQGLTALGSEPTESFQKRLIKEWPSKSCKASC